MAIPKNGYLGGFNPSGPGSYEDQFMNPGEKRAVELRDLASFTAAPRNAGTGGNPVMPPRGATTGGPALPGNSKGGDITLGGTGPSKADKVAGIANAAGDGGTGYVGGKLQDMAETLNTANDWANPYAKPDELGPPTPPPLVQAVPVGDPGEWAQFPAPPPPRPPSKLREDDAPSAVAAKPSGIDPATIFILAVLAIAVLA